jgi:hypothetical protein
MKNLLLLLVVFNCKAQDTLVFIKPDLFKRNYIEIGYGKPQGELQNKYEGSFNVGYWVRNKVNRNQFIDIGLELDFLSNSRSIAYNYQNESLNLLPNKIGMQIGVRYSKIVYLNAHNHNFYAETNSGLGWGAIFYKKTEEIKNREIDFDSNINTIYLEQTIKFHYKSLGFYVQYKYIPYSLFNRKIENNFGNTSLNIGLTKGFNL